MKKANEIFKSFPVNFCSDFTGTSLYQLKHSEFGSSQLLPEIIKNSSNVFKNRLYKNICKAIDKEVEFVNEGIYEGAKDEPIVNSPLIKLLAKYVVEGIHKLNNWVKYPELMEIAEKLSKEDLSFDELAQRVTNEVRGVESKMPYKAGFVWEELGQILGFEPA